MSKQLNKVRKRLESRRRQIDYHVKHRERTVPMLMNRHDEARDEPDFYYHPIKQEEAKPVTKNRDFLLMRTMMAICLFLIIAILFKTGVPQLESTRQFVKNAYEQEFQFAAISNWYENQFGRPLALVPTNSNVALGDPQEQQEAEVVYAVPASGTIREDFRQNGRGILVETGVNAEVEAVKGGYVIAIGEGEESIGKQVVVQHYDGTESIYGMLNDINVNIYDHIQSGDKVGTVSTSDEAEKGIFYFALKKGDTYFDPNDVMTFE